MAKVLAPQLESRTRNVAQACVAVPAPIGTRRHQAGCFCFIELPVLVLPAQKSFTQTQWYVQRERRLLIIVDRNERHLGSPAGGRSWRTALSAYPRPRQTCCDLRWDLSHH